MSKKIEDFPVLETERLRLRMIEENDAPSLLKYLSDKDVMQYYGLKPFTEINEALNEISWYQSIYLNKSGIRWGITWKEENEVIGSCGFLNGVSEHCRTDIGYELSKDYWGQGIASEALVAVLEYGFNELELERVQALIEPPNISSMKLVEKHGFIREGLLRNYEYTDGKFDDLYMYALLKRDFK
ncbi:GNAT family N-acetyltransferase [Ornithinibacillus xuwenensis]|uniref:GNAT family protein n=1 Tax=Ornithinibacillus xuwenensis TaxID=3144668 RepID=A0ABU9XKV3_9BACI